MLRWALLAVGLFACGDDGGGGPGPASDAGPVPDSGPGGECASDEDCDDGLFCNGAEQCITGACMANPAPDCDDGLPCTIDRCSEETRACEHLSADFDGDGHQTIECGGDDCDDMDPSRFPGNDEVCDGAMHDEDCDTRSVGARDADMDGYIDSLCCNVPEGGAPVCGTDCNDLDPGSHPTESEVCDETDNDCDGSIDDGVDVAGFADDDHDLHGDMTRPMRGCPGRGGFSTTFDDCDDTNPFVHGAQPELCDGLDNDCNMMIDDRTRAVTWYRDLDGDLYGSPESGTTISCEPVAGHSVIGTDCDDGAARVNPGASEVCNGRDDDCDGEANFVISFGNTEDDDGDRHPDMMCMGTGDDCNDEDPTTYLGATEQCDGRDNDCDGISDGGGAMAMWFPDLDGDGYGNPTAPAIVSCEPQAGRVPTGGDCDDSDPTRHPGAADGCNGVDEDCDMEFDETAFRTAFYRDADMDGAGGGAAVFSCRAPAGTVETPNDCDDTDAMVGPTATETCDLEDDDCDMRVDEGAMLTFYADADGDGYGVAGGMTRMGCTPPAGFGLMGDCDDTSRFRSPGETERCDLVDNDCDATVDESAASACALPNTATSTCSLGTCRVMTCSMGFGDCDGMPANGCEVDTRANSAHCGACRNACSVGDACSAGTCLSAAITDLYAAAHGTYALRESGGAAVWGRNLWGVLGDGSASNTATPVAAAAATDATVVSLATTHGCAVTRDGRARCWGGGGEGQLGDGTRSARPLGIDVPLPARAVDVAAGDSSSTAAAHSCFALETGRVWCTGANGAGQLGRGTTSTFELAPAEVMGITDAVDVAVGYQFSCARRRTGAVMCWGQNAYGQLGDGTAINRSTPVTVLGLTDAIALADTAGVGQYMCALRATGVAVCWGIGGNYQLGQGSTSSANAPVTYAGITNVVEVAVGADHTCVRQATGDVWCVGAHNFGQLGHVAAVGGFSATPARVALPEAATDIAIGVQHSCAILSGSRVWCWGDNQYGQMGSGTIAMPLRTGTPQMVVGLP